jgi:hypothetical protein
MQRPWAGSQKGTPQKVMLSQPLDLLDNHRLCRHPRLIIGSSLG